jgi:hypothetical protein
VPGVSIGAAQRPVKIVGSQLELIGRLPERHVGDLILGPEVEPFASQRQHQGAADKNRDEPVH